MGVVIHLSTPSAVACAEQTTGLEYVPREHHLYDGLLFGAVITTRSICNISNWMGRLEINHRRRKVTMVAPIYTSVKATSR